jgi:hypothetical protein
MSVIGRLMSWTGLDAARLEIKRPIPAVFRGTLDR